MDAGGYSATIELEMPFSVGSEEDPDGSHAWGVLLLDGDDRTLFRYGELSEKWSPRSDSDSEISGDERLEGLGFASNETVGSA